MSIFPGPQPGGGSSGPIAIGDIDATGTPSASTFLRGDGAWETPAGGGGSDPFKSDSVTVGNTKTTLQLTGLDLNTDKRYMISGCITQDGTGSTDYYLRANGVVTNLATLRNRTADGSSFAFDIDVEFHKIKDGSIYAAFFFRSDSDPSNAPVYTGTIANLTSIEIVASAANRIGQYSYVDLWKMGAGPAGPQGDPGPVQPQNHISYKGFAAKGSTNTNVARWSTQIAAAGTDLAIVQSAANGDYFSVATAGYYTITAGAYSSGIHDYQIHVGSAVDNSVLYSATHYRAGHTSTNGYLFTLTWTGYIAANDRIWLTCGGLPTNTDPLNNFITITRIS